MAMVACRAGHGTQGKEEGGGRFQMSWRGEGEGRQEWREGDTVCVWGGGGGGGRGECRLTYTPALPSTEAMYFTEPMYSIVSEALF